MTKYFCFLFFFIFSLGHAQTMVLYVPEIQSPPPPIVINFTGNLIYHGTSVLDTLGVTYYNDPILSSATIEVEISATTTPTQNFTLSASHPSGLSYTYQGPINAGTHFYTFTPNSFTPNSFDEVGTLAMTVSNVDIINTVELRPRVDVESLRGSQTAVVSITVDGKVWMDRPLGAHRAPTHITDDVFARGSQFQWGRESDGHEIVVTHGDDPLRRTFLNPYVTTQADDPNHSNVIINETETNLSFPNKDWRVNPDEDLWRGTNAPNNPCPAGFRVPTVREIQTFIRSVTGLTEGYQSASNSPTIVSLQGRLSQSNFNLDLVNNRLPELLTTNAAYHSNFDFTDSGTSLRGRVYLVTVRLNSTEPGFSTNRGGPATIRCIAN